MMVDRRAELIDVFRMKGDFRLSKVENLQKSQNHELSIRAFQGYWSYLATISVVTRAANIPKAGNIPLISTIILNPLFKSSQNRIPHAQLSTKSLSSPVRSPTNLPFLSFVGPQLPTPQPKISSVRHFHRSNPDRNTPLLAPFPPNPCAIAFPSHLF